MKLQIRFTPMCLSLSIVFMCSALMSTPAHAAKAMTLPLLHDQAYSGIDITGDGVDDNVLISTTKRKSFFEQVKISVNGSVAYSSDLAGKEVTSVASNFYRLSNGEPFLELLCSSTDSYESQLLLHYEKKALAVVLDMGSSFSAFGNHTNGCVSKVNDNSITVSTYMMAYQTGPMYFDTVYKYSKGMLKRAVNSTITNISGMGDKGYYVSRVTLQTYESKNKKKKALKIKKGQKVYISKLSLVGKTLWFQFRTSDKKKVWYPSVKKEYATEPVNKLPFKGMFYGQ